MFERFTDRARCSLVLAQEEARLQRCNFLDTEHILLGLIGEGRGVAARVLSSFGVELEGTRQRVEATVGPREGQVPSGSPPFTPAAKKVMELSLREALGLGHNYIGTEHLLLGLGQEGQGVGARVLDDVGAGRDAVRATVLEVLASPAPATTPVHPRNVVVDPSPALATALRRAGQAAAGRPVTTGQVLVALADEARSQAGQVLGARHLDASAVTSALEEIPLEATSDAPSGQPSVEIRMGARTTVITDADLVASLNLMSPDDIRSMLRRAISDPGTDPAD